MDFRVHGLPPALFNPLFALPDAQLEAGGRVRKVATGDTAMPCRVSLQDAAPGEEVILTNYAHLADPHTPYRAKGPIFVRKAATQTWDRINEVPPSYLKRLLSVRAYDKNNMIVAAHVAKGDELLGLAEEIFGKPGVEYIHVHYAAFGCYHFRIDLA